MNTIVNTEDFDQLLGFWPLIALLWAGIVLAAAIGFALATAARPGITR